MYNYDFKNELVVFEYNDCLVENNDKVNVLNVLVTNKNILFFYNQENDFVTLKSRGIFVTPTYELVMRVNLKTLKYVVEDNNTIINSNIIIFNFNLKDVLNKWGVLWKRK